MHTVSPLTHKKNVYEGDDTSKSPNKVVLLTGTLVTMVLRLV